MYTAPAQEETMSRRQSSHSTPGHFDPVGDVQTWWQIAKVRAIADVQAFTGQIFGEVVEISRPAQIEMPQNPHASGSLMPQDQGAG
jgi:hypothetical protein